MVETVAVVVGMAVVVGVVVGWRCWRGEGWFGYSINCRDGDNEVCGCDYDCGYYCDFNIDRINNEKGRWRQW